MAQTSTNERGEPLGDSTATVRYILVAALLAIVFFTSYRFAVAKSSPEWAPDGSTSVSAPGAGGSGAGCACCGNAGSGEVVEGVAVVEGDVQRIMVDASAGYDPNVIRAIAGVPLEITFSQGFGCMAQVMSEELGFFEDLVSGPKTVRIPALLPGEYGFSCGMEMVFGSIVVE